MTRILIVGALALAGCRSSLESETSSPGVEVETSLEASAIPTSVTVLPADDPVAPSRVIFLGDSITVGFGADDGLAYPELLDRNDSDVWPQYSKEDLQSQYGTVEVINVAVAGATSSNVVERQLASLEKQLGPAPWAGETLVFLTIGGNDLQFAIPRLAEEGDAAGEEVLGAMESNLETILAFFDDGSRFSDGTHVYFTNVYEPTDGVGSAGDCLGGFDIEDLLVYLEGANEMYHELALDYGAGMVDLRTAFLGHGMHAEDPELDVYREEDPSVWFADDCIHPNERGHHEVRRLFFGALLGEIR